jgi:acyl carrier protein
MDRKEIEDKVKEILAKELNIKKENITPEKKDLLRI